MTRPCRKRFHMGRMMLGMRSETSGWRVVGMLLLAGLALRLVLFHFHPPVSGDSLVYGDIATNILRHHMYALTSDGVVKATLIRLPGYPLFLAFCFSFFGDGNFLAAVWMQIILSLADCCLLGLLASRLMGRRAGFYACAMSALCPFTANYSVVPLTETLSLFCVTLAFFAFERWASAVREGHRWNVWLATLAAIVTFCALLRPDRALLCGVLVPAVAWVSLHRGSSRIVRGMWPAAAMIVVFLLPLSLWGARNWRVFHVFQPLSPKYANDPGEEVALGFMQWYRTWGIDYKNTVEVYWPYDGSLVNFQNIPDRAFNDAAQRGQTQRLIWAYNEETSSTPALDAEFSELAQGRIASHPVRYYVLLPLARLADMWFHPRTELLRMPLDWWRFRLHAAKSAFSFAYAALNAAYLVLAAVGISKWRKQRYSAIPALAWSIFAFVVVRSALLATLDNAEQRYTIDCFPVILLLASFAFAVKPTASQPEQPSC